MSIIGEFLAGVGPPCLALALVSLMVWGVGLLVAFAQGWVVWGPTHQGRVDGLAERLEAVEGEMEYYRRIAFDLAGLAHVAVEVASGE